MALPPAGRGGPDPAPRARRGRRDPLALWMCGLAALGSARAWLHLVRDGDTGNPAGWIWLGGSLLLAVIGVVLLVRDRGPSMAP